MLQLDLVVANQTLLVWFPDPNIFSKGEIL